MTSDRSVGRDEVTAILQRLVSFDTESSRSNLELIDYVDGYLRDLGVASIRMPNAAGDKATLFATIGPTDRGGICLSGHTDVVPVAGQSWTSDPFKLRLADGKAYGRGAVDMKGFCALALAHVPLFQKSALKTPIHLILSYDEETTCLGVEEPIARIGADLPRPRAVIVGEPTSMQPADAHKSVVTFNTYVHGFEAHSSKPELGVSAIKGAVMLMSELDRIGEEMIARGEPTGRFDPPYTSLHIGEVHGGTARNIMAKLCSFYWEFRGVPGLDPAEIPARLERYAQEVVLPRLTARGKPARIETINEVSVPGLSPDPGSVAETLALKLTGRNRPVTVAYGSEAGHFQGARLPTILCGPGSIDQAHQPDEFITLEQIDAGAAFMRDLAQWCATNG
ncbi:MAG TPA: acetylornithine deacetylase [Beijerinckiaceae bacterium]|jgi:acetylornithine deacetylase|nr:acetylornithine deacetylase [Beijerinckiaceae bacterium]